MSIALLIALVGFPQISETIYTPALPAVANDLHTSANLVEMTLTIYFLGFAVGVILWGMLADRYGRRTTMLAGLVVYGISTFICGNAESIENLLMWRFIQAFGASVGSVITQTILRDLYEGSERAKLFSIIAGALAFSPAIGPLVGGYMSELLGWRANFSLLFFLALVLFIWSYFSLAETRPACIKLHSIRTTHQLFKNMMKSQNLWGHIFLISGTNGLIFGFYQEAPFVFIEQLGMTPGHYGLFGVLISAALILAARVSYYKSSYSSPQQLVQQGVKYVCLGATLLMFMVISGLFSMKMMAFGIIMLALFCLFFGIGLIIPNSLSQALKPYQFSIGTAGSIFGGCYYCLVAGFTWILSFIHNETPFPFAIYIVLLMFILMGGNKMIKMTQISNEKMI